MLEFPHEKNHWDHLSIDVETLSKYWICAGCAIYTFHRCCASVTKVLGPKETPGRTSASNKAMGTLLSFRNRKEEHHSSFPHNLFIKWFQPKWRTPDLQTVGANESVLQSDEDLWAECIDIFCRACCQKKALVSSKDTLGASQYLVSGMIYKAMKSNLSQLKGSGKKKGFFWVCHCSSKPGMTGKGVYQMSDKMYILYLTSHQCFIVQGQLKVSHFAYRSLCIWRSPSVSVHSFREVDGKEQLPLFCFSSVSTRAMTYGHDHRNLRYCRGKKVFQDAFLRG